jgi:two-component system, LytTR family, response regulator
MLFGRSIEQQTIDPAIKGAGGMIQAILVDDEILARQKLRQLLGTEPDVEIIGEGATAAEALDLIRVTSPDVLFLDVRMPDSDGFNLLRTLSGDKDFALPRVVFTTAYDSYALRAFEMNAVDYLLKPFTRERLHAALQRVRRHLEAPASQSAGNGSADAKNGSYTKRIVFKSRGRILFLPVSEIRWIAAEENYVRLRTATESHLLRETMSHLTEKLDPEMFLRVHRSFIVNLQYVKEVRTGKEGESAVFMADGQRIGVSRGYRSRIQELLHN